ncbi:hypothetical protein IFM5058_10649 [Aspergillus udagawae]|nr:hypothetical protein IFM5058_10649 [Aspergillus udagawae]
MIVAPFTLTTASLHIPVSWLTAMIRLMAFLLGLAPAVSPPPVITVWVMIVAPFTLTTASLHIPVSWLTAMIRLMAFLLGLAPAVSPPPVITVWVMIVAPFTLTMASLHIPVSWFTAMVWNATTVVTEMIQFPVTVVRDFLILV